MLSDSIGVRRSHAGRMMIRTRRQEIGHAMYGPYVLTPPGTYRTDFVIALLDWTSDPDAICLRLDVATGAGQVLLAERLLRVRELTRGFGTFPLAFALDEARELEFRAYVYGTADLLIVDDPRLTCLDDQADGDALPPA